jgi:hypothetical protein
MPTPPGYPASFASFAFRLDCPPSLPTTSVDQNAKAYSHPPTAQSCDFPQTEQSSDRFINWAARIILRHRSFLLSINMSDLGSLFPHWDASQTTPRRFVPSDQLRHQWAYCFQGRKSTFHSAVRVSNSNHQPPPRAEMRPLAVGSV